jgi:D-xylose 1-dehydrogenase (NADP+, D-xylono-1,5-lactone-forming)
MSGLPSSGPVRWGILSTARINAVVIPPLHESPESELVAVASRDERRAHDYADGWRIPRAYGSYDELLADPDVEAVYISLPNGSHIEWSIRALEAGKHVLCEKPLTRDPASVERAFDVADREGLLLMEAFMWRHHSQTAKLLELVVGGAIGELRLVRATFSFTLRGEDVRLDPALEGGALMDVGCYCVSGARLLAGEPTSVTAQQLLGPTGVDLRLTGTLAFPGDVLAVIDCAFDLPDRQGLEVVGSAGVLHIGTPWGCHEPGIELLRDGGREWIEIEQADRYRLQSDNLSRAIRGLEAPLLGRADALGQARAIDALYRAAETGEAARVPVS